MDLHKEYPKTVGRTEFWKQIKRTVNGQEVSEQDILMIVSQVKDRLDLRSDDHLLDLGCGNGALAHRFFEDVGRYRGVDFSEYLLGVAEEFFNPPKATYVLSDMADFVRDCKTPEVFTKVLVYGVVSYLSRERLTKMITRIRGDFRNVSRVFIGNIPNAHRAGEFYAQREHASYDVDDPLSPIGVWWTPEALTRRCEEAGFEVTELHMPEDFYGAPFRFDLLLSRR